MVLQWRWKLTTVENGHLAVLQRLNIVTVWLTDSTPTYIPKRSENISPTQNLYVSIPSSVTHNSRKVEAIQMSVNWWVDKQLAVDPYHGLWFSNKKNDVQIHTWKQYVKWKEPQKVTYEMSGTGKPIETKSRFKAAEGFGEWLPKGVRVFWVVERFGGCTAAWMLQTLLSLRCTEASCVLSEFHLHFIQWCNYI